MDNQEEHIQVLVKATFKKRPKKLNLPKTKSQRTHKQRTCNQQKKRKQL